MALYLRDDFAAAWAGADAFEKAGQLQGKVYRNVKARRTLQFIQNGNSYFVKIHEGIGWREIFKDLVQFRKPVLGAENEWLAIKRLQELDVDTMTAVAYGKRGSNPATQQSFIITEDLINTVSLEDYCAKWPTQPPTFAFKLNLISKLADVSRCLHAAGICHRDYYICHFLLQKNVDGDVDTTAEPKVFLIDLHRALMDRQLSTRWIIKDVAGLYFSALHIGLTRRDFLRFVKRYTNRPLRAALQDDKSFWQAVTTRAAKLDKKTNASRDANKAGSA